MLIKITSIGEILWDVYPDKKRLGGAPFNFIYHVWKLTGTANFISSVGSDVNGSEILDFLNSIDFPTNYIKIDKKHPTGTVLVKLNDDKTPEFNISQECSYDFLELDDKVEEMINSKTDLIYFGTLSQRNEITHNTIKKLYAKKKKYFCDLNLRHNFFNKDLIQEALSVSNVIKINLDELEKIKKYFLLPKENENAVEFLSEKYSIDLICVTYGAEGALLYNGTEFNKCKSSASNIVDTVGAGDAFAAVLSIGYLKKMELSKLNQLANDFASEICSVNGAIPTDDLIYNKYKREFENGS